MNNYYNNYNEKFNNAPIQLLEEGAKQRLINTIPKQIRHRIDMNREISDMIDQLEQKRVRNNDVKKDIEAIDNEIERLNALNDNFAGYIKEEEIMRDTISKKDAQDLNDRLLAIQISVLNLQAIVGKIRDGLYKPYNKSNRFSVHYKDLLQNTLLLESRIEPLKLQLKLVEKNNEIVNKNLEGEATLENVGGNLEEVWENLY